MVIWMWTQVLHFYCQEGHYSFKQVGNRLLGKRFARTNVLKNIFFHRVVDRWIE